MQEQHGSLENVVETTCLCSVFTDSQMKLASPSFYHVHKGKSTKSIGTI